MSPKPLPHQSQVPSPTWANDQASTHHPQGLAILAAAETVPGPSVSGSASMASSALGSAIVATSIPNSDLGADHAGSAPLLFSNNASASPTGISIHVAHGEMPGSAALVSEDVETIEDHEDVKKHKESGESPHHLVESDDEYHNQEPLNTMKEEECHQDSRAVTGLGPFSNLLNDSQIIGMNPTHALGVQMTEPNSAEYKISDGRMFTQYHQPKYNGISSLFRDDSGRHQFRPGSASHGILQTDTGNDGAPAYHTQTLPPAFDNGGSGHARLLEINQAYTQGLGAHYTNDGFHGMASMASAPIVRQQEPQMQHFNVQAANAMNGAYQVDRAPSTYHSEPSAHYHYGSNSLGQWQDAGTGGTNVRDETSDHAAGYRDDEQRLDHDDGSTQGNVLRLLTPPAEVRDMANDAEGSNDRRGVKRFRAEVADEEVRAINLVAVSPTAGTRVGSNDNHGVWHNGILREAIRVVQLSHPENDSECLESVENFYNIAYGDDDDFEDFYNATDSFCFSVAGDSRVPYLHDTMTAPVDDETAKDAHDKLAVKIQFVKSIDSLQGDELPTKRRGNLPKESTAVLKQWFDDHKDHPYPSDEQKLELSRATRIAPQQISHWFINHRKRVWKPSLPLTHPVHSTDSAKRPRRRAHKRSK